MLSSELFDLEEAITLVHHPAAPAKRQAADLTRAPCSSLLHLSPSPTTSVPFPGHAQPHSGAKGGDYGPSDVYCGSRRSGAFSCFCRRPHLRRLADAERMSRGGAASRPETPTHARGNHHEPWLRLAIWKMAHPLLPVGSKTRRRLGSLRQWRAARLRLPGRLASAEHTRKYARDQDSRV
jgi:hypothetical protein